MKKKDIIILSVVLIAAVVFIMWREGALKKKSPTAKREEESEAGSDGPLKKYDGSGLEASKPATSNPTHAGVFASVDDIDNGFKPNKKIKNKKALNSSQQWTATPISQSRI